MKAKILKDALRAVPEDFEIEFHCLNSTDWDVSVLSAADSDHELISVAICLTEPLDPSVVYIY